ncbi:alpha/beta-hydrolase [Multifurca ochricompacta]|uniref:Alpha/beta-hydrolase n=1 Tax=Multifurca ochricompacta TaxID=376703 RepID=A0AAD4QNJ0_9AGAM|nr:alpha/beta-hydrolase [Multifurca ochricompacta]
MSEPINDQIQAQERQAIWVELQTLRQDTQAFRTEAYRLRTAGNLDTEMNERLHAQQRELGQRGETLIKRFLESFFYFLFLSFSSTPGPHLSALTTMDNEQPFQIAVPEEAIELLKRKLEDARLPDEISDAKLEYGAPLAAIKRLAERWKSDYGWRKHERELNLLPMFTRSVEVSGFGELNVHYVHQKSTVKDAIPLLFVHGWPGSFLEVTKVLPLLTAGSPDHPSFHVVAPSLPGYAWSEGVLKKGFNGKHYAELFNKLMISLGYTKYVTQGGDWGHVLTLTTASKYGPHHVKASHTNFPMSEPLTFRQSPLKFLKCLLSRPTASERKGIASSQTFFQNGMGYFVEQSTKPQTLGYGLADSPVGLLAWIYEKLVSWTDGYPWTDDEVLTWVSIYWFSRAGPAASVRIYYELAKTGETICFPKTTVPIGLSFFPKELAKFPKSLIRAKARVVFESEHEAGGHFAAYEQPDALVGDLRKMFGRSGPAAAVVPGCTGY